MDDACECDNCGDELIGKEAYCVDCKDNEVNDIKTETGYYGTDRDKLIWALTEIGIDYDEMTLPSRKVITLDDAVEIHFHSSGAFSRLEKVEDD